MSKPDPERLARIEDVRQQAERVIQIHAKLRRGESISETDAMTVRRLIRLLVEEWV